ncbi:UNVERIFIED_CONTAM: hypothetical protein RMT77_016254 [Armadillidium vulgare]
MTETSKKFFIIILISSIFVKSLTIKSSSYSSSSKICSNAWKVMKIRPGSSKIACSQLCNSESKCLGFSLFEVTCSLFSEESLVHGRSVVEDLDKHCYLQSILLVPSRAASSSPINTVTHVSQHGKGRFLSELLNLED